MFHKKASTMKKFLFVLSLLALFAIATIPRAQAQSAVSVTVTSYADTISGAETHTYDSKQIEGAYYWAVQILYDHISGSADSCKCKLQTSLDGTNFIDLSGYAQGISDKFSTSDTSHLFTYATAPYVWTWKYLRISCQHWVTGTARFKIYLRLTKPN